MTDLSITAIERGAGVWVRSLNQRGVDARLYVHRSGNAPACRFGSDSSSYAEVMVGGSGGRGVAFKFMAGGYWGGSKAIDGETWGEMKAEANKRLAEWQTRIEPLR